MGKLRVQQVVAPAALTPAEAVRWERLWRWLLLGEDWLPHNGDIHSEEAPDGAARGALCAS